MQSLVLSSVRQRSTMLLYTLALTERERGPASCRLTPRLPCQLSNPTPAHAPSHAPFHSPGAGAVAGSELLSHHDGTRRRAWPGACVRARMHTRRPCAKPRSHKLHIASGALTGPCCGRFACLGLVAALHAPPGAILVPCSHASLLTCLDCSIDASVLLRCWAAAWWRWADWAWPRPAATACRCGRCCCWVWAWRGCPPWTSCSRCVCVCCVYVYVCVRVCARVCVCVCVSKPNPQRLLYRTVQGRLCVCVWRCAALPGKVGRGKARVSL